MLICIIGKSASGKTTLSKNLTKNKSMKLLTPITTRPIRENEKNGQDYIFLDKDQFLNWPKCLSYCCEARDWYYAFDLDDIEKYTESKENIGVVVLNHEQFLTIIENAPLENLLSIYIEASDKNILERSLKRSDDCEEVCRRFLADKKDFANLSRELSLSNYKFDIIINSAVYDFNNDLDMILINYIIEEFIKNEK